MNDRPWYAEVHNTLSDEQFETYSENPQSIERAVDAQAVIAELDADMAQIMTQIESLRIELGDMPMPVHRKQWLERAAFACAVKRRQRRAVARRLAHLNNEPAQPDEFDPAIKKAMHELHMRDFRAEREANLLDGGVPPEIREAMAARNHEQEKYARENGWRAHFLAIVWERFGSAVFAEIKELAKARRDAA